MAEGMVELKCNVKFNYDRPIPWWFERYVQDEYMKLRNIACGELNGNYETWNSEFEFEKYDIPDDDELKDFGGTEYCEFIRKKQEPIIESVNKRYSDGAVKLYSTRECDIGAIVYSPFWKKEISRLYITIEPIE